MGPSAIRVPGGAPGEISVFGLRIVPFWRVMIFFRAMADKDKASGMKSAYELALERIESQGIARPKEDSLTDAQREQVADIRRQAEARIAELEILHRDRLQHVYEPAEREKEEQEYVEERNRIEEQRERKIEKLRGA